MSTTATKTRKSKPTTITPARDAAAEMQAKVIEAMEKGVAPWKSVYVGGSGLPLSISTGKAYRGGNTILLWIETMTKGYTSPWWGTYKRITELGGQVRKGEKGSMVIKWLTITKESETSFDENGNPRKVSFRVPRVYTVFNLQQADWAEGIPTKFAPIERDDERTPLDEAEAIIAGYKAQANSPTFVSEDQGCAWYRPSTDTINTPQPENIVTMDEYYSTLFHEMTHSTGHKTREDREGIGAMTPGHRGNSYAFEELVAEFGAAMLCGVAGIESTMDNSGAYLRTWASRLREADKNTVLKAASLAQRAMDRILGVSWEEGE